MSKHSLPDDGITSEVSPLPVTMGNASEFMIKRARELVNRLIECRGREGPPFLAEEYAPLQGIKKIERADLGELDALLLRLPDGYVIKVNSNHSQVKQNYSCAHEIVHTFLHELERQSSRDSAEFRTLNSSSSNKNKERLCEAAAAELLMPESIFRKYLSRFGLSVTSVEWLAHIFMVSIPATAIRISQVSEEFCIALQWKMWQKGKSKRFYLVWPDHILKSKYVSVRNANSLLKAYESNSIVKSFKSFEINRVRKRCYMESKGFGRGNMRYVISLVFPERQDKVKG